MSQPFSMETLVNERVKQIEISGIRQVANLVASSYPDAITLTLGQPDFQTPDHIIRAAEQALAAQKTTYTPNAGLLSLREAISAFVEKKYGQQYRPQDEIIVTNGASQALDMALRTILTEGCEVILPAPIYPGYEPIIRMCGATVVYADTTAHGFKLTAEVIKPYLTEKTRCVLLCYPSNPTGRVLTRAEAGELAALLSERNLVVLSDEIYSELIYEHEHVSIATFPGMRERTVVINGLSKSHAMTGWRIGYTLAPSELSQHMLKVHQYNVTCASSISQYAAIEALQAGSEDAAPMREQYKIRRDLVVARLLQMGFELEKPEGAFYVFPSIRRFGLSSMAFTRKLLEEQRLAVVPGNAFSPQGEGYIRLSYAYALPDLEKALDRLEAFVSSFSI